MELGHWVAGSQNVTQFHVWCELSETGVGVRQNRDHCHSLSVNRVNTFRRWTQAGSHRRPDIRLNRATAAFHSRCAPVATLSLVIASRRI